MIEERVLQEVVRCFETITDKNGSRLNMDSVIISRGPQVFRHDFNADNAANDLRSLSKPTLCLALGIALERGLTLRGERVSLDTLIWPYFEDRVRLTNHRNRERLSAVRLRHVLSHTMGFDVGLMFSKDVKHRDPSTLLEYIFDTDLVHEPGEFFVYSNVGPYVLSALIHEELGVSLAEWVSELLFVPVGIREYEWKHYGKYCAGCTGLKLVHADLHKIARVLVDDGQYEGQQIVPSAWVSQMRRPQVETPSMYDEGRVFPKYAYGYYLWICRDGRYYCDGTDGQYLIALPRSGTVITTFGHQPDMKPITVCLKALL